ncbi:MAG: sugar phosphate isomerase/epimerase [Candidatus Poribacteria bacterium]|nr:sugar phosphate isomerase/epimerase [Candidatus Poribacteria bacterium]
MIKLGCNSLVRDRDNPGRYIDIETMIHLIHELRLDIIDFQLDRGFRSLDAAYLRRIKIMCHNYGLPIGFVGIGSGFVGAESHPNGGVIGVPLPEAELQRRIDEVKGAVDVAVLMGAPLIRLFGGSVPEGTENRSALWETTIRSFQQVADYAAEKGILIGLHNHPPAVAPTGDDILRILEDVDRENFTFILDTGQWWGSPGTNRAGTSLPNVDIYKYMEQTAPHASYVRAKIYKIDTGREEWLDYKRIIAILKGVNFNGNMSIVFEDRGNRCDYAEAIGLAVKHLRQLLADTVND